MRHKGKLCRTLSLAPERYDRHCGDSAGREAETLCRATSKRPGVRKSRPITAVVIAFADEDGPAYRYRAVSAEQISSSGVAHADTVEAAVLDVIRQVLADGADTDRVRGTATDMTAFTDGTATDVIGSPVVHARVPVRGEFIVGPHAFVVSGASEISLPKAGTHNKHLFEGPKRLPYYEEAAGEERRRAARRADAL